MKPVPTKVGLVLHYPFSEGKGTTALDASGNGHDGTLVGPQWGVGARGPAVLFKTNDLFTVKTSPALAVTTSLTIAAFVIAEVASHNQRIISYDGGWELKLDGRKPALNTGDDESSGVVEQEFPVGEWHHVAVTFEAGVMKGYIDGIATAVKTSFGETKSLKGGAGLTVGSSKGGADVLLGGVGDLRLYSRALTPAEIAVIAAQ